MNIFFLLMICATVALLPALAAAGVYWTALSNPWRATHAIARPAREWVRLRHA